MSRSWRGGWTGVAAVTLACLTLALGGCELLYYMGAKNTHAAAFTLPKKHKFVVVVDLGNGVSAPPTFCTGIADNIGRKIWQDRAVDTPLISQDRLVELRQANPEAYERMKLGDIAHAVQADNILYVCITRLETPPTADGTAAEGIAEARVKVLDKDGNRVWPAEEAGKQLSFRLGFELVADRNTADTLKALSEQITTQVDALFHESEDTGRHVNGADAAFGAH